MEVFRSDGSGGDYANKRLFELVSNIQKKWGSEVFKNINTIQDHKGTLCVYFKDNFKDIDKFIYFVVFLWEENCEHLLEFYLNNNIYKKFE